MAPFIVVGFQKNQPAVSKLYCASKQINLTQSVVKRTLGYFQAGCFPGNFVKKTSDEAGNTGW